MDIRDKYTQEELEEMHDEMTLTDMYDVIEQICNCDCSVCHYCNDEELKSKLFETAKLHKTNCVCLLTRFYQGFRTESLLQFLLTLKIISPLTPSKIKNWLGLSLNMVLKKYLFYQNLPII